VTGNLILDGLLAAPSFLVTSGLGSASDLGTGPQVAAVDVAFADS
jgi:hypothetical protein